MQIIGICGYSGSGKTTLLKQLIPVLKQLKISLAVIKHSHHQMEIDIPGKDSYELRQSGAEQVIVASNQRWALITETADHAPDVIELAKQFSHVDLVLVEGFKDEPITKIICHRAANQKSLFYDAHTVAIVSDTVLDSHIKQFADNDVQGIANFIRACLVN